MTVTDPSRWTLVTVQVSRLATSRSGSLRRVTTRSPAPMRARLAGGGVRVVDPSGCDQLGTDGVIERADLLVGVRDDDRRRCLSWWARAACRASALIRSASVAWMWICPRASSASNTAAGSSPARMAKAQLRVVLVRHRDGDAVRRDDGAGEAMHRVEFPVGFRVHLADGQVEHSPATDGRQLVPVADQSDPSVVFVGDRSAARGRCPGRACRPRR